MQPVDWWKALNNYASQSVRVGPLRTPQYPIPYTTAKGSLFFFFCIFKMPFVWAANTVSFSASLLSPLSVWFVLTFVGRARMIRLKFDDEYARVSVIHNLISTLRISAKECVIHLWVCHSIYIYMYLQYMCMCVCCPGLCIHKVCMHSWFL